MCFVLELAGSWLVAEGPGLDRYVYGRVVGLGDEWKAVSYDGLGKRFFGSRDECGAWLQETGEAIRASRTGWF